MAIATAEAPTPNLLAIPAIEIPISRLKKQPIAGCTLGRIRGVVPEFTSLKTCPCPSSVSKAHYLPHRAPHRKT